MVSGKIHWWKSSTPDDANRHENWFGVGKNKWIEPDHPFMFINHSCAPNLGVSNERDFVALREIEAGEELTFDYAITEDEQDWSMECQCGVPSCRRRIGSIHTLPHEAFQRYLPYVGGYFQRLYLRSRLDQGEAAEG